MSEHSPYRAEFLISGEAEALKTALLSLEPECGDSGRTKIELEMKHNELFLVITAMDSTALRAGINSYLRWLNEALEVFDKTKC